MKKIISIISILLTFSLISYADFETGNTLYKKLIQKLYNDAENFGDRMRAWGYVIGVFDSYRGLLWAEPPGITQGQVIDVAKKYLEEHPEQRHQFAVELLIEAFSKAFPKKKEGDKKGRLK